MAKKGQQFEKYDDYEFKLKVIKEIIEEGKTVRFISKKYGIPRGTIETWVYKYKHKGIIEKQKPGRSKHSEESNYKEKYEILKKFLESLEEVKQEKK